MAWWSGILDAVSTGGASSGSPATTGGFDWGDVLNIGGDVLGNVLPAIFANEGADAAADAARGGNEAALNLSRDIYQDQVARSEPWRQAGLGALNFQNQWLGLPQVVDTGGASTIGTSTNLGLATNWGAGQPVAGHSGGGGSNPLASAAGGIAGSFFGPVGSAVGGALGGLVRSGGDNWKTLQTIAPEGYDYDKFWNDNPDLQVSKNGWPKADVQALFNGNRNAYLDWFQKQSTDRKIPLLEGYEMGPNGVPVKSQVAAGATATAGATGAATPNLWETIKNNPLYVAATEGFLGVNGLGGDKQAIEGAFATGGQLLSGAEKKALQDRSTARSSDAISRIWNQYADVSGTGSRTVTEQNSNAGAYGVNAGNLLAQNGQIAANASANKNANWQKAGQNVLGGIYDYSKNAGWIN